MSDFDERIQGVVDASEKLLRVVEVGAAFILVVLFAIGVFDFAVRIVQLILSGNLSQPEAVIGLIDTALLLFIIVEVFQTVVAYVNESSGNEILRIVLYTGVIAVVRKIIIFRPSEYDTAESALFSSIEYSVLLIAISIVLIALSRSSLGDGD